MFGVDGGAMLWLWTWGGTCFGYRQGDDLWTHDGRFAGRFQGNDVYGRDGRYLGEFRAPDRLVVDARKRARRLGPVVVPPSRRPFPPFAPRIGYPLPPGHADFPSPAALRPLKNGA